MNKPKQIFLSAAMLAAGFAHAQPLAEGAKMVRYERFNAAKAALTGPATTDARAAYYLGLAQLGSEDTAAAIATFSRFPDDAANLSGLARIQFLRNNSAEGLRLSAAAADKGKKKDWEPLKFAGDAVNYGGGPVQKAIEYYKQALTRQDNDEIRLALGDAYRRTGPTGGGEAMNNYEAVTARSAGNSFAYSKIGNLWYAARRYDSALTNYSRAKETDVQNPLPYRDLANAYFNVGRYELAKQNVDRYYDLSDKTVEDKIQRMNILFLAKYYDSAIIAAQELIAANVNRPYIYRILGYSQYEKKDYPVALSSLQIFFQRQDAARVLPSDYKYYGLALMRSGAFDSGRTYLERAVAADSTPTKTTTLRDIAEGLADVKGDSVYRLRGTYYGRLVNADTAAAKVNDYYYWGYWNYFGKAYADAATAFRAMEAKSAANRPIALLWQGKVAAAGDPEAKSGSAVPFYTQWLAEPETEKYIKAPKDLMQAYQYMAYYAYQKGDKAQTKTYADKILAIEPTNKFATDLLKSGK